MVPRLQELTKQNGRGEFGFDEGNTECEIEWGMQADRRMYEGEGKKTWKKMKGWVQRDEWSVDSVEKGSGGIRMVRVGPVPTHLVWPCRLKLSRSQVSPANHQTQICRVTVCM